MSKKILRVGFIGAGSIGSLFGGYIANIKSDMYSIEVIFFCMKDHARVINKKGLKLFRNQEVKIIKNIMAFENEKQIEEKIEKDLDFKFDFLFLTTKAYDIKTALIQYKKIVNASRYIVILQNGIGNEDVVIQYSDKIKIIRAVTTNGALLDKPGQVFHTGEGITKIGFPYLNETDIKTEEMKRAKTYLQLLGNVLNLAGFATILVDDMIMESWEKALVNIGINAIAALTRLTNGELLKVKGLEYYIGQIINEAIKVAELKKIMLPSKDYVSIAYDVLTKTANNKNSMLQDILNNNPTEINFLNGKILKDATDLGIKVPYNEFLTYLIKSLEKSES
ncbi:MAG: ketopantoate reductase family protein [Candidatus Thorarchaeota archaeon]